MSALCQAGEETGGPEKGVFVTYDLGAGVTTAGALVGPLPPNPRALVVIPTYSERESIGALLGEVRKVAAVDILVVDDRSPDGTAEAVTAVQAADAAVHLLVRFDLSRIRSEGYCFQIELSYAFARNGFRVAEIPILFEERRAGQSKMSLGIVLKSLTKVWALRFAPPTAALRPSPEERATARR